MRVELAKLQLKEFEYTSSPYPTPLINGIQLTSAWNPSAEALLKIAHVKKDATSAWLYGPGGGFCQFYLTQREQYPLIEKINVVVLSRESLLACLDMRDQSSWLEDPRVEFTMAFEQSNVYLPIVACPASMQNCDSDCTKLRGILLHALNQPFVSEYLKRRDGLEAENWEKNAIYEATDPFVTEVFGTRRGQSALIVMGGPTLTDNLRHAWKYDVKICATTSMRALQTAGIKADYVVLEDPLPSTGHFNGVDASLLKDSVLCYNPTAQPEMLKLWPWKRLRTRVTRHKPLLFEGGSVAHAAADIAVQLGCSKVALMGFDTCNVDNKTHYAGALEEKTVEDAWRPLETNGLGQRVISANNLVWYRIGMEAYIKQHPEIKFYQYDKRGIPIEGCRWAE